jgi:uncharacterized MAPEG superfamily protein
MTPDLTYLAYTALLLAALWLPYTAGLLQTTGMPTPDFYRDPAVPRLPLWVQRANRAHINLVQAFAPFAALVLIAHVTGQSNAMTAMWAMVFFWTRIAHAIIHIAGIPYLRTVAFAIGFIAVLGLFWEIAA